MDGETIREWMEPAYTYADGTGFGHPWELVPLGNYTLRTKDGVINGYNAELQFAVRPPQKIMENFVDFPQKRIHCIILIDIIKLIEF